MNKRTNRMLFIFMILALNTLLFGEDWPRWRGPNGNSISNETDWNAEALIGTPNIQWEINVGDGHSAISVKGDRLYTMGNKMTFTGSDTTFMDHIYCIDTETGREIWRYSFPCDNTGFPGPRTTPAVDENSVYTLSWQGHLFCFDAENGSVKWMKQLAAEGLSGTPEWGFCGSPIVEGDLLLLTAGSLGMALNKNNGAVVWKSDPGTCDLPSPVLFNSGNKRLALIPANRAIHAVEVHSGQIVWTHPWSGVGEIDPIIFDKKLFLPGYRRSSVVDISGSEPKELFDYPSLRLTAFQNFAIIDDHIYAFIRSRNVDIVFCTDLKTGKVKWRQNIGNYGALIAADHKLIILKGNGELVIAKASPDGYQEISNAQVIQMPDNTGVPEPQKCYCWTYPTLANGKIYARNNRGQVVCVDVSQ